MQIKHISRLAARISAYFSGDLRKYEHFTGDDLGYKPSVVEQAKFDYSPLGKVFNKVDKRWSKRRTFEESKKYWR